MAQLFEFYKNFQSNKNNNNNNNNNNKSKQIKLNETIPDEELSEIERTIRYCKSTIGLQRLINVKILGDVCILAGYEATRKHAIPFLESISGDSEVSIRQNLCPQVTKIAKFCVSHGAEDGYRAVLDIILPVMAHLLEDEKQEVRQAACSTVVSFSTILTPLDLGQHVLTIILQLAHDDMNEDMRITAVELLNSLAESLGSDLCRQFIIPEVISLAEDSSFLVRRAIALNYYNICKISGEYELFEKLMPTFVRLSKDDVFRVRRACAECLYDIAERVEDDIKIGVLIEIFLRLAEDPSLQVKEVIYQQSGKFISTLPTRVINKALIGHYLSCIENPLGDASIDTEVLIACAFSIPGVLYAIGKERWPEIRRLYHTLVNSTNILVRKTLALSLHEIGRMVGPTILEEELIPVFEEFIQDVEPVRFGIIKYMASLMKLLSMPCRVSYIPLLRDILLAASPYNWRLRQLIASQIKDLVVLLPIQNVYATLFPLTVTLIQDRVAQVRSAVLSGISKMIQVVLPGYQPSYIIEEINPDDGSITTIIPSPISEQDIHFLEAMVKAINALFLSDIFIYRQIWAELGLQLLKEIPFPIFEKYFIPGVLQLTLDPIPNVRVKIAELLAGWEIYSSVLPWEDNSEEKEEGGNINPWKQLLLRNDIKKCIQKLSHDDRDVYVSISKLQPLYPDIEFKEVSCRGVKVVEIDEKSIKLIENNNIEENNNNNNNNNNSGLTYADTVHQLIQSMEAMKHSDSIPISDPEIDLKIIQENEFTNIPTELEVNSNIVSELESNFNDTEFNSSQEIITNTEEEIKSEVEEVKTNVIEIHDINNENENNDTKNDDNNDINNDDNNEINVDNEKKENDDSNNNDNNNNDNDNNDNDNNSDNNVNEKDNSDDQDQSNNNIIQNDNFDSSVEISTNTTTKSKDSHEIIESNEESQSIVNNEENES